MNIDVSVMCLKQREDHNVVDNVHLYNTRLNRPVEPHNLEPFKQKTHCMGVFMRFPNSVDSCIILFYNLYNTIFVSLYNMMNKGILI